MLSPYLLNQLALSHPYFIFACLGHLVTFGGYGGLWSLTLKLWEPIESAYKDASFDTLKYQIRLVNIDLLG